MKKYLEMKDFTEASEIVKNILDGINADTEGFALDELPRAIKSTLEACHGSSRLESAVCYIWMQMELDDHGMDDNGCPVVWTNTDMSPSQILSSACLLSELLLRDPQSYPELGKDRVWSIPLELYRYGSGSWRNTIVVNLSDLTWDFGQDYYDSFEE